VLFGVSCAGTPETKMSQIGEMSKISESKVQADRVKHPKNNPEVIHYIVPAMSIVQRLPNSYPEDGELNGELRILAASLKRLTKNIKSRRWETTMESSISGRTQNWAIQNFTMLV
jgi:hypothetical protein